MRDACFWRLVYGDDSYRDEPLENTSIRNAPPGAVELHVCVPLWEGEQELRRPALRIDLRDGYRPVFYRTRAIDMNPNRALPFESHTVFGRGRETDDGCEASLWRWRAGKAEDAPRELIDGAMVRLQLGMRE